MSSFKRLFFLIVFSFLLILPAYSQSLSHDYLIELGQEEFNRQNYSRALHYFKMAQTVLPGSQEAIHYINLVRRKREGRLITDPAVPARPAKPPPVQRRERIIGQTLTFLEEEKKYFLVEKERIIDHREKINLLDASLEDFPLTVELPLREYIFVTSKEIERFLVVSPDVAQVERVDRSTLEIKAKRRGSTFIHIWDKVRRWTINLQVVIPEIISETEKTWEEAEGFDFIYSSDWSSYYRGRTLGKMEKSLSSLGHRARVEGPTPYGDLSGNVEWRKAGDSHQVTGYGLRLTEGRFLDFEDFSMYGFDFSKSFSSLSLPGRRLRGFAFQSPAFNRNLEYTLLHGKERPGYYGYLSSGIISRQDAYIEGVQLSLFPYKKNKFFLNYAQGRGSDRQDYLQDKVFSLQSEHRWGNLNLSTEIASDQSNMAAVFSSRWRFPDLNLRLSMRNIDRDFMTITGRPPNIAETGGIIGVDWTPVESLFLSSSLDLYKDKYEPEAPNKVNLDWDGLFNYQIGPFSYLQANFYYQDRPGVLFPQRRINTRTTYNRRFPLEFFNGRALNTYVGYNYQQSKNPRSPFSDYRRNSLLGGMRLELLPDLYGNLDYTHTWLEELATGQKGQPAVMRSGLSYYYSFFPSLSSDWRVQYRKESEPGLTHSFLAGEDSLEGNISLTYTPGDNAEIFFDGRLRNVWPDDPARQESIEAEIRLGARLSWDSFFRWSPSAKIEGTVFQDSDGDGVQDEGEEGLAGIKVLIGPQEVYTDSDGKYSLTLKAKKAVVSIDLDTLAPEYVLTTPSTQRIDLSGGGKREVNFGLSSQSGLYGVVFDDLSQNQELDQEAVPIARARLILNRQEIVTTNNEGVYFFGDIAPGVHTIELDVSSLPENYLPTVPIKKEIKVKEGFTQTHHFPLTKR